MTFSRILLGDSNVRRFWNAALKDRSNSRDLYKFKVITSYEALHASLNEEVNEIVSAVVVSSLTNALVSQASELDIKHSTSIFFGSVFDELLGPFCDRHPSVMVIFLILSIFWGVQVQ